jgi:hypothetical protein
MLLSEEGRYLAILISICINSEVPTNLNWDEFRTYLRIVASVINFGINLALTYIVNFLVNIELDKL